MGIKLTDSRLAMWRAVLAMAHTDGVVMPKEAEFGALYMDRAGASDEQREILREDLQNPQDPAEMFARIIEPSDKADFFEFARALLWCDGDFSAQEKAIVERLQKTHIDSLHPERLAVELHALRDEQALARMRDEAAENGWAKRHVGLGAILSRVTW